jgi:sodium-dependent dicarboxylate transporter 2/3/5
MRGIFIAVIVGSLFFGLATFIFSVEHSTIIGLVAFLVTLWTNEAMPLGAVSILPIILFPLFGPIIPNQSSFFS